jgi:hypothetical protein
MDVLKTVVWTISGAKAGQSYTVAQGTTTDLTNPTTHSFGGGSVGYDGMSFYWDATPGEHTIQADVTYSDDSTATVSATVTIDQPTVDNFSVTQTAVTMGTLNNAQGMSALLGYSATVSTPPDGAGTFALIQKVNRNDSLVNTKTAGGIRSHNLNSAGLVLDNWPGDSTDAAIFKMPHDTRTDVAGSQTQVALFAGAGDQPGLYAAAGADESGTYRMILDVQFITYLVYRPTGGIWVEVAETPTYSVDGTMTYDATAAPPQYNLTGGSVADTIPGVPSLGFVSWTSYYSGNPAIAWTPSF